MMSGHGANPIFFNRKYKDWMSRRHTNPHPRTSDNISFLFPADLVTFTEEILNEKIHFL